MHELLTFDVDTRCIVHFKEQEGMPAKPYYQVMIGPDTLYSPTKDFIRFNHAEDCEIHGWRLVDSIIIDEVLEEVMPENTCIGLDRHIIP